MMSTNASQTESILNKVSENIYRWIFAPIIIFGLIGHTLNIILFTRPNLRSNSCCNYYLTSACVSIIEIIFGQIFRILKGGYRIVIILSWWCRLSSFLYYSAYFISMTSITLAAMDRYASSCYQAKHRRWATIKVARCAILIVVIVASLSQSHILFLFEIDHQNDHECWAPKGTKYRLGFDVTFLITHRLIFPILMGTFAFLTLYNIRQRRASFQHKNTSDFRRHRIRDFQRMTLVQIICLICFTLPHAIHRLHRTLTSNDPKSREQLAGERLSMCLVRLLWYLYENSTFYIYTLSSVKFRRELSEFLREYICWRKERTETTIAALESPNGKEQQPPSTIKRAIELDCFDLEV